MGRKFYDKTEGHLGRGRGAREEPIDIGADKPHPEEVISGAGIRSVSSIRADRANVGDRAYSGRASNEEHGQTGLGASRASGPDLA